MRQIIVSPTREQLLDAFDAAARKANGNGRTRLVSEDSESRADLILTEDHGYRQADGGGVANAYGYQAETSILAYAWYTRADGSKVVRIAAGRCSVSGRHVSSMNLGTRPQQEKLADLFPAALVHAELMDEVLHILREAKKRLNSFQLTIKANLVEGVVDTTLWLVYADWCDEVGGKPELAAAIRAAFQPVAVTV